MRSVVVLVVLATAAHASPLEKVWETKAACRNAQIVEWHDTLAFADDHGRVQRVARATGKLGKPLVLGRIPEPKGRGRAWEDYARIEGVVGDDLVIHHGHEFAVVDGTTGKVRWVGEQPVSDGGLPYLVVAGGDVLWVHPAHLGQGDPPVFIERLAIATGKQVWRAEMPSASGQVEWAAADAGRLYVVTSPDMIGATVHAAAFDLTTGKRLWTQPLTSKLPAGTQAVNPGPFVADGGKLYYVMPGVGLDTLDGATGKQLGRTALSTVPDGARTIAIGGARAYVATRTTITAIELPSRMHMWTITLGVADVHVTPAALFVGDRELVTAHALDDGRELASWGIARSGFVYTGLGVPAFVMCEDDARLVAFDPSGTATPVEHATITGRLICGTCKTHLFPPLTVQIGDATASTDARGNFTITVDARGTRELSFDLPHLDLPIAWVGDTSRAIRFTGKKKYALGNLRVVRDCGPLEPPC